MLTRVKPTKRLHSASDSHALTRIHWGAHTSRVLPTASRRRLRYSISSPPFGERTVVDAANHMPEAYAPQFLLHGFG